MVPPVDAGTRYANLYAEFRALAHAPVDPKGGVTYLEVGVFDGTRTVDLARYWNVASKGRPFRYFGFDLFEGVDRAKHGHEILKGKPSPTLDAVHRKLVASNLFDQIHLQAGDTRETLPRYAAGISPGHPDAPDIVFIDGGHSLETIASDWAAVAAIMHPWATVLFDDYLPDRTDVGAKPLVDALALDPAYRVTVLKPVDFYPHTGLSTCVAKVERVIT